MFCLKSKKHKNEDIEVEIPQLEAENEIVVSDSAEVLPTETSKEETAEKTERLEDVSDFYRLAKILCTDKTTVLEECKLYEIRKIMSKISRAVVRYGLSGEEIKSLVKNADVSGLGEIAVSPAYLNAIADKLKNKEEMKVSAVIDFPFGEASFKVKLSEIKNSVKKGVDGVLTIINASEIKNDNSLALKKQLKKIRKFKSVSSGVAVSAEDIDKDGIKRFLHIADRAGMDYAAFLFGNVSERALHAKMKEIMSIKGKITVKVMANVENVSGVKALIECGADGIITPYADKIAKELFTEFKINSVKLV